MGRFSAIGAGLALSLLVSMQPVSAAVVTVTGMGGSERSALKQALREAVE